MAPQSSLFHPSALIKAQAAKRLRLRQQFLNVASPLRRGDKIGDPSPAAPVTPMSRNPANKDGDTNNAVRTVVAVVATASNQRRQ